MRNSFMNNQKIYVFLKSASLKKKRIGQIGNHIYPIITGSNCTLAIVIFLHFSSPICLVQSSIEMNVSIVSQRWVLKLASCGPMNSLRHHRLPQSHRQQQPPTPAYRRVPPPRQSPLSPLVSPPQPLPPQQPRATRQPLITTVMGAAPRVISEMSSLHIKAGKRACHKDASLQSSQIFIHSLQIHSEFSISLKKLFQWSTW